MSEPLSHFTGSAPRLLPCLEPRPGVQVLRTAADAARIKEALSARARVVVVGGGCSVCGPDGFAPLEELAGLLGTDLLSHCTILAADLGTDRWTTALPPFHALSYAPLAVVAATYRAAGAEVWNLEPAR